MPRRSPLTPAYALVATLGVLAAGVAVGPAYAAPTPAATSATLPGTTSTGAAAIAAAPRLDASEEDPLQLRIEQLTPTVLTRDQVVRISGTVTNASDETWTEINLAPFHSAFPITDAATLNAAAELPDDAYVGDRLTDDQALHKIDELAPGESATFTTRIPRGRLDGSPGVHWVGVHASGVTATQPRDSFSDGRARTFLPVAPANARPVPTALVLPIRATVRHTPEGRIDDTEAWATLLGPGGRLEGLLGVATEADGPVTWLVDPAVPHAVSRLAAGNPARSLAALPSEPSESPQPEDEAPPNGPTSAPVVPAPAADDGALDEEAQALAALARGWLEQFREVMADAQVLALPYGDVDVSAMAETDAATLAAAYARSAEVLDALGISSTPVVASPDGQLTRASVEDAPDDALVLLSEDGLTDDDGPLPTTGTILDHEFAVTSSGIAAGGPGPEDPGAPVAVRQRVVSEAVLRQVSGDRSPLVIAPPTQWDVPAGAAVLFSALDTPRFRLSDLRTLVRTTKQRTLGARSLVQTADAQESRVPSANVLAATRLVRRARLLESVLTNAAGFDVQVRDTAMTLLSHQTRRRPAVALEAMELATAEIDEMLGSITIAGPASATLSGESGTIGTTLSNGLDVPVTVNVEVDSSEDLVVDVPNPVAIPPDSRRRMLLPTSATREGVQSITLRVADDEGTSLGGEATIQVRASEVGRLLWLIMGGGAIALFGTIAVRLSRRGLSTRANRDVS